jgi:HD-GYP domain-containing protein (c-di-GMP phosphodiesterase class II)
MIGVSDEVMQSVDTLTDEGCEAVQEHPVLGARMLQQAQLEGIAVTVRHHHERWDGTGYPDRLAEQDIPLAARILSLCDAFDAMVSPRSYREPRDIAGAVAEIRACSGSQFDPVLAGRFIQMVSAMKAQPGH